MEFGLEICRVFEKPQKTPQPMYTNTHTRDRSPNHLPYVEISINVSARERDGEKGIFLRRLI